MSQLLWNDFTGEAKSNMANLAKTTPKQSIRAITSNNQKGRFCLVAQVFTLAAQAPPALGKGSAVPNVQR